MGSELHLFWRGWTCEIHQRCAVAQCFLARLQLSLKRLEKEIHKEEFGKNGFIDTMDPLLPRMDQISLFIKLSS